MKKLILTAVCIAALLGCSQQKSDSTMNNSPLEQNQKAEEGFFGKLFRRFLEIYADKNGVTNNPCLSFILQADESELIADELFSAGVAYQNGAYFLPKDLDKAASYFRKAAERGHAVAQLFTAMACIQQYDDHNDEVLYWLQKAAEQGEPQAMYNLAISYHRGDINGQVDIEKSNTLFRMAAEKGYPAACSRLAIIYRDGTDGFERDIAKAKFWAFESYANNKEDDQAILDAFFTEDDFVDGKLNTNKIYDNAAAAGEPHALYHIGNAYAKENIAKAVELWTKAAESGCLYAKCNLAVYYRQEKQDYETANKLLEDAAKFGIEDAQDMLAESYYYGLGVEKDVAKAWEWNEKAVNLGFTPARYLLAVMCLQNELTEIIPDKVYRGLCYMNQAAEDDYPLAIEYLKKHNSTESDAD
ncbi:MAG: sel1 repeat family protein [Salinivirgaceae bacterium]|nr:sel1 repeat family protein [Salinivirgaceae bacterium]